MSTSYYALRHPVERVVPRPPREYVLRDFYGAFIGQLDRDGLHLAADRDVQVAHRSGASVVVTHPGPDEQQAISEWGELVTLGALRRGGCALTPAERREAARKRYAADCDAADLRYREVVAAAERECNERYEHAEARLRDTLAFIAEQEATRG